MDYRLNTAVCHTAIFAAATAAIGYQFVEPGYYLLVNFDAAIGPKFTAQFMESLRQGILYPRWLAESYNGLGSPTFVYYSPLLYFMASLLSMAGLGMPSAFSACFLIGIYAGGASMFHLLRRRHGDAAGLVAALCVILLPTKIAEYYLLNTLAGRFAQSWLPAVLLFTDRFMEGTLNRKNLALMAAAYAALVCSHIATAFIFTPFVIAFGLFGEGGRIDKRRVVRLAAGLITGLCLAGAYFLPVLLERGYVQLDYFQLFHDFHKFFIFEFNSRRAAVPIEGLLTIMRYTVATELFIATVLYYLWRRQAAKEPGLASGLTYYAVSALACLFLMSSPSVWLWEVVPGLSTTGYPARFGAVFVTFLSALIGIILPSLIARSARPKTVATMSAVLLSAILLFDAFLVVNSTRYTQEEASAVAGRIDLPEYLPRAAELSAVNKLGRRSPLLSSDDDFSADIKRWGYTDRLFDITAESPVVIQVKTFYFPGWRAWVDGKEVQIKVQDNNGAMLIDLPTGRHEVELRFTDTPVRSIGAWLSLFTLAVILLPYRRLRYILTRAG